MTISLVSSLQTKPDPFEVPSGSPRNEVVGELKSALEDVEQMAMDQEDRSAHVFARSAKPENVGTKHKGWKVEVYAIKGKLAALETKVSQLRDSIPYTPAGSVEEARRYLVRLADRIRSVKEDNFILVKLLPSPIYTAGHALCRSSIKECEDITSSTKSDKAEKKAKCEELLAKTQAKIKEQEAQIAHLDPNIKHQIKKLHTDAIHFVTQRIAKLSPKISKPAASQAAAKPVTPTVTHVAFTTEYGAYICSFSQVVLLPAYGFQNASWFGRELYQEQAYKEIWTQIEGLKNAGRGVQQLKHDVQSAIDLLLEGISSPRTGCNNLTEQHIFYTNALHQVEIDVQKEASALLDRPPTVQVHTGLYYARRLSHGLSKIKHMLNALERLSLESCTPLRALAGKCNTYTNKKMSQLPYSSSPEIEAFFDAAQAAISLPVPPPATHRYVQEFISSSVDLTKKILAVQGQATVKQELTIQNILNVLLKNGALTELCKEPMLLMELPQLPEELTLFIKRQCCNWLFYSTSKGLSLELSLILALLEGNPLLQKSIETDSNFKVLVEAYKKLARPTELEQAVVNDILKISKHLRQPYAPFKSMLLHGETVALLVKIAELDTTTMHKEVAETLHTACKILEQAVDKQQVSWKFPPRETTSIELCTDPEQLKSWLFSSLIMAIWGSATQKQLACQHLRAYFTSLQGDFTKVPELGPLKLLLVMFSIVTGGERSAFERQAIQGFQRVSTK